MATEGDALEAAKKHRTVLRRFFTLSAKKLETAMEAFEGGPAHIEDVMTYYQTTQEKVEMLTLSDTEILNRLLAVDIDDEAIDRELEEVESYRVRWNRLLTRYRGITRDDDRSVSSDRTVQDKSHKTKTDEGKERNFRYPQIEFVKFNGDPHNWLNFWGQFSNIDKDESLDNYKKFQYLIQATEQGSKARDLINSFPPSADNYKIALEHLKERFGKEELIIEVYVRDLLNLVLSQVNGTSSHSLCELYDKLTTQVRALESLGVTSDKYAAMLYPMVESALPSDILRAFERTRSDKGNRLTQLLEFLRREVESIQRIEIARGSFTTNDINCVTTGDHKATAATLVSSDGGSNVKKPTCVFCDKSNHVSNDCLKLHQLSLEERKVILKKKNVCPICLRPGHHPKFCRSTVKCFICKKRHNTVMCNEVVTHKDKPEDTKKVEMTKRQMLEQKPASATMSVSNNNPYVTFLQTLVVTIRHGDKQIKVRTLIDNGSQRSYITKKVAEQLGLSTDKEELLSHSVFGGLETTSRRHKLYNIIIGSIDNKFNFCISVLEETKICGFLPRLDSKELQNIFSKHKIELTDVSDVNTEIGVLIGADYAGMIMTGEFIHLGELTAIKTKLGWTVQGPKACSRATHTLISLVDLDITNLWKLESIGINDSPRDATADEVIMRFEETIKVNAEGRYEVPLPWKEGHQELLTNRELAYKRLLSTSKRLTQFEGYDNVFKEWLELGIIEPVLDDDPEDGHYLAHHAVIKNDPNATTRIRPVFDGSAKDKNGISINGCLEKGENFLETIPTLIIQFRAHKVGITSDIRKAFLQISVSPEDRKYLKFLWWKDEKQKELITYQHCRVVFGLTCSPFLLAATINHHLLSSPQEDLIVAEKLRTSFYVDNCVTSVESEEAATNFIEDSKRIMSKGEFDLRGWIVSSSKDTQDTITSILGVGWHVGIDELGCFYDGIPDCVDNATKRLLLSIAQKTFDPIGFTAPVTLVPKVLLQKCWLIDLKWDEQLPEELLKEFKAWFETLHNLRDIRVPRRLSDFQLDKSKSSLHVFCDASQSAYATCIFLRTELDGNTCVRLILAKARVTPTKQKVTMPRLELLAATIGARLANKVKEAFDMPIQVYYWTDSKVTLTWIKKTAQWAVFVNNRVKEIRRLTDPSGWRHVPGSQNPADLPSRGCDAKTLHSLRWWEGPSWLLLDESQWPRSDVWEAEDEANQELCKSRTATLIDMSMTDDLCNHLLRFSQYTKIVRSIAWIKRFARNCKPHNEPKSSGELSTDEYKGAEVMLVKLLQKECLTPEVLKNINLDTFTDEDGIIRVRTKLTEMDEKFTYVYPILLKNHPIVIRLVEHKHRMLQHAGLSIMMANIREEFWIMSCRKLVRRVVSGCCRCRRFSSVNVQPIVAPLPLARIDCTANAFKTTGVDLAGPLYLSTKEKAYIVIFTCAVYRAIYLELVTALSTEAFLMALRRFFARHGRVKTIYSDNGTNFHGLNNLFKLLDWPLIHQNCSIQKIRWIFNVPTAAWWGGWWERMVRSIKELLRRVLGQAALNYEQLMTVVCDVESVINSRPLSCITEGDSVVPLTPSLFVRGMISERDCTDLDAIDAKMLTVHSKKMQRLREALRKRFRNEYIGMLVQKRPRSKSTELKLGEVVLLESDAKKAMWPLGLITELIPGRDGVIRAAKVKTAGAEKLRPLQKLYPLECRE